MDSVLSLLGIALSARKLFLGEQCLENMNKVKFLFIASDASDKTKERYLKKCKYYSINYSMDYCFEQLSKAIGKNNVKIIGVIDDGFKKTIENKLNKGDTIDGKTNL